MKLDVAGQTCHLRTGATPLDSSRTAIVLIHGAANDSDVWMPLACLLGAAGYAVLAPDLPGHGLSGGKAPDSIEALADWVLALLDAAGAGQVALAGHSMGALIALETAARHPRRVKRLALLGATLPMPVSDALIGAARHDPDSAIRLIARYSHTPGFYLKGGEGHGVWGPGLTLAIMRRSPHGVLATDLENCHHYVNGATAASRIECPTLLLIARNDRMTPRRNVAALQGALRHATRTEISDCGHAMMSEHPERVSAALIDFLALQEDDRSVPAPQLLLG